MHAFLAANFGDKAANTGDVSTDLKVTKTNTGTQFLYASTKSRHTHCEVSYQRDCYVFFGRETKGLPEDILHANYDD